MTHVMSKPNVGTWVEFESKLSALALVLCSLSDSTLRDANILSHKKNLFRSQDSEVEGNFLNDITKTKCQKNWLQSHIKGEAEATFDVKDVIHNNTKYHTLLDIDIKLRTPRVMIRQRQKTERFFFFDWQQQKLYSTNSSDSEFLFKVSEFLFKGISKLSRALIDRYND